MEQRAVVCVCSAPICRSSMPTLMPSLIKYFITVGAILFVGLVGLNAVLEPGGPGPRIVQDSSKPKLVRHDPRASLVERLREEEAAQRASGKAEASVRQAATALTGVATDEEVARSARAHERAAAEKPRKKRIVRERSRSRPIDDVPASR